MIGDHRRREESGHLEPAVTVRRTHHGDLDAHVAQSSDAICPVSFDWGAPLELEAKFGEELNGGVDVFYHDADVVHPLDRHDVSLASNEPKLSGVDPHAKQYRSRRARARGSTSGGSTESGTAIVQLRSRRHLDDELRLGLCVRYPVVRKFRRQPKLQSLVLLGYCRMLDQVVSEKEPVPVFDKMTLHHVDVVRAGSGVAVTLDEPGVERWSVVPVSGAPEVVV